MGRITVGTRVQTPLGPGRVISYTRPDDHVPPHGKVTRGVAFATVELDRNGQRRIWKARELDALDS